MLLKKIIRFILISIVLLIVLLTGIYNWASSANHSDEEYVQLIENDFPPIANRDSVYSIITYNIGYLSGMTNNRAVATDEKFFDNNLKKVCSELHKFQADLLCFQEIDFNSGRSFYVNQQEAIQKVGYNYGFQAVNWDERYVPFPGNWPSLQFGQIYSGQSIVSKYPIEDPERLVLDRSENTPFYRDAFYLDRLAQVAKIRIGDRIVVLVNVHLEAFDKMTRARQTSDLVKLYKKYADQFPVLLVGDYNSDVDSKEPTIEMISKLPGIAMAKMTSDGHGKTFPSSQPKYRLDYIFYNEKFIDIIKAEVLTSFGEASDHLPVMMEFVFKKD